MPVPEMVHSRKNDLKINYLKLSAAICAAVALLVSAGCRSNDTTRSGLFEAYRADLPQGNYVTAEMLKGVKVGMSKTDVQRALGTPLLTDIFIPKRWNYVFSFRHPSGRTDIRRVIIRFDQEERVSRIEADRLPEKEDPTDPALPGFDAKSLKRSS